jgi:7-cyano-7-deazaguanine synthase
MHKKSTVGVLVSGGLDSAALAALCAEAGRVVTPIYIRQGLRWEAIELYWLHRFLKKLNHPRVRPLQIFSLPMADLYDRHWSVRGSRIPGARSSDRAVYLPGRNLVLTVKAAIFCAMQGLGELALGPLDHNPFPDATPKFFKQWEKAISLGLKRPLKILTPFRTWSKVRVIQAAQRFPLELTFSCLSPKGRAHCGRCNKCAERKKAFRKARVADKTIYGR